MDIFNIVYYGIICGILGVSAPFIEGRTIRFIVGIFVGVVGASLLPAMKSILG